MGDVVTVVPSVLGAERTNEMSPAMLLRLELVGLGRSAQYSIPLPQLLEGNWGQGHVF